MPECACALSPAAIGTVRLFSTGPAEYCPWRRLGPGGHPLPDSGDTCILQTPSLSSSQPVRGDAVLSLCLLYCTYKAPHQVKVIK